MALQHYRLFLLDTDGRNGCGVVDITAHNSDELPRIVVWQGKHYVRAGSYAYTYHEAKVWEAPPFSVNGINWRVPAPIDREERA